MTDQVKIYPKLQSGFSLIEILVSMLIIGIGLLGLGGLQVASLKGSGNAHSRNIANMLAMELSDRMRANPIGAAAGDYVVTMSCNDGETDCRRTTSCTAEETAKFDIQEIMCGMRRAGRREGGVANLLTSGELQITAQPGDCIMSNRNYPNAQYKVDIGWRDRNLSSQQSESAEYQSLTVCLTP